MFNKTIKLMAGLLVAGSFQLFAAGDAWMTDFEAAKAKAAKEEKALILEFTGSDWCPPCKMMTKKFFSQEDWVKKAQEDFVLVLLDFPNDKSSMSEETIAQNEKLSGQYGITAFPTIIVADASGKPFAFTGFFEGSIEEHVASLVEEKEAGKKMMSDLKATMALEDQAKAEKLQAVLSEMPAGAVSTFYADELAAIAAVDPDNAYVKEIKMESAFAELEQKLGGLMENRDFKSAVSEIRKLIEAHKLEGNSLQKARFYEAIVTASMGKTDEAKKIAEKAAEIDPDSAEAQRLRMVASQVDRIAESSRKQAGGGGEADQDKE